MNYVLVKAFGVVTKKGLGIPIGAPSITPVPRMMILNALKEVTDRPLKVTLSVPGGIEMAEKTTNARLGILGGISILGTTGIVRPFSTAAYRASVVRQIDVAFAQGERRLVLATGSRSEAMAMTLFPSLDPVCFVEVGDFTGVAIRRAARVGMEKIALVAMVGKITKLASGIMMTHFHRSDVDTKLLEVISKRSNAPASVIYAATQTATARHFFEACIASSTIDPLNKLCAMARDALQAHASGNSSASLMDINVYMVDFEGSTVVAHA
jgi:cobalamin biosynthesis protein CbiD